MCGCRKNKGRARSRTVRPQKLVVQGAKAGSTQVSALGVQPQAVTPREAQQMDGQRRRIEKLRRDAVKKRLGR